MPKPELKEPDDLRRSLEAYAAAGGPNGAYARVRLLALDLIAELASAPDGDKSIMVQAILMGSANAISEVIGAIHPDTQAHWAGFAAMAGNQALVSSPNIRKDILDAMMAALRTDEFRIVEAFLTEQPKTH